MKTTSITIEDLKPCPFCGREAILASERLRSPKHIPRTVYYVACEACEAVFFYSSVNKEKIVTKWNTRT